MVKCRLSTVNSGDMIWFDLIWIKCTANQTSTAIEKWDGLYISSLAHAPYIYAKQVKVWVSDASTEDNFQDRSFMASQSLNNITFT